MCERYEQVLIPIPAFIRADPLCTSAASDPSIFDGVEHARDVDGRECFVVDACLVPALRALWDAGIKTTGCCCGHGSGSGVIGLVTYYGHEVGMHINEAPPYSLIDVTERRRHENAAYERGRHDGFVEAGREDLWLAAHTPDKPIGAAS